MASNQDLSSDENHQVLLESAVVNQYSKYDEYNLNSVTIILIFRRFQMMQNSSGHWTLHFQLSKRLFAR